jgi:NAD(P)-dependent dehydrogenase (short-subunit alcohol dehydrogenase family)
MGRVDGQVALVTGAARTGSIGRGIAMALAQEGADIAVNDFGREEEAQDIARAIRETGRRALVVLADISKVSECRRVAQEAANHFGGLDILVNNAGQGRYQLFEEISEGDYDQQLDLHLKGPFFLTQAVVPYMRARGGGRVINISSEIAYIGHALEAHYTAAKGGLRSLTKALALALAPTITVNTICPGPTATDRFKASDEYSDEVREKIPLRRFGHPVDVARSVVFLASPDGDAYTGQTLDPNCGTVMD